ncbi:MAG: insulinase family protein [Gemmataceae bacterium]|nr:insulinase family protein [Gemmataceae bacterium]
MNAVESARAADPALRAAAAFYDGVKIEKLPNGLTVVLKPVPGAPTVTTFVAYKVGSADEDLAATGLAHYLEHLMFKGTEKLVPGDIDRLTLRNGGKNNAWTNEDLTTYHFDFAADRWEPVLDIEADRMRNLRIDEKHEFQQEKGAVIAELDRNEDNPFDLERKLILPRLFGADAPYGHPIIGERPHVRGATAEVIKGYYDRWYHPNNAVMVVCGGFDPERTMKLIREKFEPIPAGKLPERKSAAPVSRTAPVRHEFASKFDSPRLVIGYNTVPAQHEDSAPLTVLSAVLSGGKSSRLYRTLVEDQQVASAAAANSQTGRYPGWFDIEVELLPDQALDAVEKAALAEVQKVREAPVSDAELNRVKRQLIASEIYAKENLHSLAEDLAVGVSLRGFEEHRKSLDKIAAVTAADVQRVAKKYLDPQTRVTVASKPKGQGGKGEATPKKPMQRAQAATAAPAGAYDLTKTQRVTLPNGMTLLLLENHRLPVVAAQVFVRGVRLSEPAEKAGVAALTGSLLDEGTKTRTGQQIAEAIEGVGGELTMSPSGGAVKVLSSDTDLGLTLLLDCLLNPSFPKEAFERIRTTSLAALEEAQFRPDLKAELLFQEAIYGPTHPFGRPSLGTKATVTKLKPADCKAFHRANFVPNRTVLAVVGDFDAAAVRAQVEKLTADWKPSTTAIPALPPPEMPTKSTEKIVSHPDAAQLYFHLGHPGIRRNDPDYYTLLVMDYVLGTGPGFTDRLSSKLRDRQGLAYTVSASITGTAGDEPGAFSCFIGTFPDKLRQVQESFLEEMRRLRTEVPAAKEVDDAKRYLSGSIPFRLTTSDQVAEQLLQIERFGLGLDYLNAFRSKIEAVTPEQVRSAAATHLDPVRWVLIAVGAVDESGKPLKP